jgi:hypothetical protein
MLKAAAAMANFAKRIIVSGEIKKSVVSSTSWWNKIASQTPAVCWVNLDYGKFVVALLCSYAIPRKHAKRKPKPAKSVIKIASRDTGRLSTSPLSPRASPMQLAQNFSAVHRARHRCGLVIQTVQSQTLQLAKQDLMMESNTYLTARKQSRVLRLAGQSAIEPLVNAQTPTPSPAGTGWRQTAGVRQGRLFLRLRHGRKQPVHSRQPELVGQNLSELKDPLRQPHSGAAGSDDKAVAPCVISGETLLGRASARLRRADHLLGLDGGHRFVPGRHRANA